MKNSYNSTTITKANNPIKKIYSQDNISSKKIYRWSTGIWKDVQHHPNIRELLSRFLTPIRMAIIKTKNKLWQGCGENRTTAHYGWVYKLVQPPWSSSKHWKQNYHTVQNPTFRYFFQNKQTQSFKKIYASLWSLRHYLQQPNTDTI